MLVVIVVAAATAFSFFVASYQKQVQAEETATHDRQLEKVKIIDLSTSGCTICAEPLPSNGFGQLSVLVASLDPNPISVTGISLNGHPVLNYTVKLGARTTTPCFSYNNTTRTGSTSSCGPYGIPAFSEPEFIFNLDNNSGFGAPGGKCYTLSDALILSSCLFAFGLPYSSLLLSASHSVQLNVVTSYGNDFVSTFIPPIPVIDVTYVGDYPILDGENSYQPSGGSTANSSISTWEWTVQQIDSPYHGNMAFYGQSVELSNPFAPGASYWINLTVTNSFGLTGIADEFYLAPGVLSDYSVTFTESGLSPGTTWSAVLGGVNQSSTSTTITFLTVPNGTFDYSVGPAGGLHPSPDSGSVWLDGKSAAETILFS